MGLIDYKNVNVYQESQLVLQDIDLQIGEGEFVYLTGKVGTGKSSFLKTLYGELPVKEGHAMVMDYDMTELHRRHLPEWYTVLRQPFRQHSRRVPCTAQNQ